MQDGRPSKFSPEVQEKVRLMARRGFTDAEMSEILDVTERTFNNWKNKHPEFFQSLKEWKKQADEEVERSLYERACGYSHIDTKFASFEGKITDSREYTKHYPPDTGAAIFWLKNRQSDEWREKHEFDLSGRLIVNINKFGEDKDGDNPSS